MSKVSVPTFIGDGLIGSKASLIHLGEGSSMCKPSKFGYSSKKYKGVTKVELAAHDGFKS